MRGRFDDVAQLRAYETARLLGDLRFHSLAFEHERYERSFAASVFIGWKASQAVATVDHFFNLELHDTDSNG